MEVGIITGRVCIGIIDLRAHSVRCVDGGLWQAADLSRCERAQI